MASLYGRADADETDSHEGSALAYNEGYARPRRSRQVWLWLLASVPSFTLLALAVVYWSSARTTQSETLVTASLAGVHAYTAGPNNATLGFGAILLMSLAERTDRQDAMSLISAYSDLEITTVIPGVKGNDVAKKAHPFGNAGLPDDEMGDPYLGSWRTKMNALRYVVDHRLETALLLEDDVDWYVPEHSANDRDVRLKNQMKALSQGLMNSPVRKGDFNKEYPYGTDWDIMHLGAAIIRPPPDENFAHNIHVFYADSDRPEHPGCLGEEGQQPDNFCWEPLMDRLQVPAGSRAIIPTYDTTGLPAIAVTYEGAQKLLYHLSWVELKDSIDFSLSRLLQNGLIQGWSILPPLFSQWKTNTNSDSDLDWGIQDKNAIPNNREGSTFGIEQSTRKALDGKHLPNPWAPGRWSKEYWEDRGYKASGR